MVHEVQSHCRKPGKLRWNKTRNGCNFHPKQSKIFLILLVTNCIVSLPMDLSLLKSHVGPDLSRQCSLVLTRWPRHYAFKDHWSEANLMIIFCPISAGNWLVSTRLTSSDQSEASVEILGANQRPSPNLANKQRRECESCWRDPGRWSVQFIFTPAPECLWEKSRVGLGDTALWDN